MKKMTALAAVSFSHPKDLTQCVRCASHEAKKSFVIGSGSGSRFIRLWQNRGKARISSACRGGALGRCGGLYD